MEQWKDIIGYEGFYQVSSEGHVKRIKQAAGTREGRVLKTKPNTAGYLGVILSREGTRKYHRVHRLVAQAFVVNLDPEINIVVNHLNGVKNDNHYSNLEWLTIAENVRYAYSVLGEKHYIRRAKLTEEDVREIRHLLLTTGMTLKMIGDKFKVNYTTVSHIKNNRIWKEVA